MDGVNEGGLMERITHITPAYDRTDADPSKNYGIHGADIRMVLKGELGAVQFVIYTNRLLKENRRHLVERVKGINEGMREKLMEYSGPFTQGDEINEMLLYERWLNISKVPEKEKFMLKPMPADLGYHSPKPMYDSHEPMGSKDYKSVTKIDDSGKEVSDFEVIPTGTFSPCEYLDGKPCYYDGSTMNAETVYRILVDHGEEAVWKYLEEYYVSTFDELR